MAPPHLEPEGIGAVLLAGDTAPHLLVGNRWGMRTEKRERYKAFLLYSDDWLSSTSIELMTPQEAGYLRLLLYAWKSEDYGIPDDDRVLARLT